MNTTLAAAAESMQATLHGADRRFDGVSTDSRTLRNGELFFALSGPNFDGSSFVVQAHDKGAAGAVVNRVVDADVAQLAVEDTRQALGQLGAAWRQQQPARVIGITGSNGKTTLKELAAACLSKAAPTLATEGNLNNDIGVPLMLLRINESHDFAVLEMGANHAGEIKYLTSLAQPNIVVITNAAAAHLEGFGSVQGVAEAKGEILCGEIRPDLAILNADDRFFDSWSSLAGDVSILSFGLCESADVRADQIVTESNQTRFHLYLPDAEVDVTLPLAGTHNVRNACAAAAVAIALGIPAEKIAAALESVRPIAGRLQAMDGLNNAKLYDDSYNANPFSVVSASEFIVSLPGKSWLVLGDMGELGEDAPSLHGEVGKAVSRAGVGRLFAVGELCRNTVDAFGDNATWYASVEPLIEAVAADMADDVNVLVKGSRFMRMERVVEALRLTPALSRKD